MAFTLPTFNLVCNINTLAAGAISFRLDSPCNLAMGRRTAQVLFDAEADYAQTVGLTPILLLPPLTDVRDASCGGGPDVIEVPAGSGRYYVALNVDDIGKGFTNEHRVATLYKTFPFPGNPWLAAPLWPTPIP